MAPEEPGASSKSKAVALFHAAGVFAHRRELNESGGVGLGTVGVVGSGGRVAKTMGGRRTGSAERVGEAPTTSVDL